ncbi:MAG: hypothetical protein ABJC74_13890 [Gemmatimonadota bacterium]
MVCERCGEHEAELKLSRVDRDEVLSLNVCAGCGRLGITDAWWLREVPQTEKPEPDSERVRASRRQERERVSED